MSRPAARIHIVGAAPCRVPERITSKSRTPRRVTETLVSAAPRQAANLLDREAFLQLERFGELAFRYEAPMPFAIPKDVSPRHHRFVVGVQDVRASSLAKEHPFGVVFQVDQVIILLKFHHRSYANISCYDA